MKLGRLSICVPLAFLLVPLFLARPIAAPPHQPWSEPVNLGATINSAFNETAPTLSKDGRSLYFSSNRPCGEGDTVLDLNIWVARRSCKKIKHSSWDASWDPPPASRSTLKDLRTVPPPSRAMVIGCFSSVIARAVWALPAPTTATSGSAGGPTSMTTRLGRAGPWRWHQLGDGRRRADIRQGRPREAGHHVQCRVAASSRPLLAVELGTPSTGVP